MSTAQSVSIYFRDIQCMIDKFLVALIDFQSFQWNLKLYRFILSFYKICNRSTLMLAELWLDARKFTLFAFVRAVFSRVQACLTRTNFVSKSRAKKTLTLSIITTFTIEHQTSRINHFKFKKLYYEFWSLSTYFFMHANNSMKHRCWFIATSWKHDLKNLFKLFCSSQDTEWKCARSATFISYEFI